MPAPPSRSRPRAATLAILAVLVLTGCDQDSREVRRYSVPKAQSATNPTPETSAARLYDWDLPEGWFEKPNTSTMRIATITVEIGEKPADCSIVKLSGEGGGLAANINRWRGQIGLEEAPEEEIKASMTSFQCPLGEGLHCELINPEAPDQAFLAAIIPAGEETLFVKLSTSAKDIPKIKPSFVEFCETIRSNLPPSN